MKKVIFVLLSLTCFLIGTTIALAAPMSGMGGVAAQVTSNLANIARLVTAGSYVAGMAFAVGAVLKFKAHKDQPAQIPVSTGFVWLGVAIALIFIPSVFKVGGATLFGVSGGKTAGVGGITSFGDTHA